MPETVQISGGNSGGNQRSGGDTLKPNTVLLRRYKIMGVLGGGGMGTVYQARDLNFPDVRRLTAVKEMLTPSGDRAVREQTLATFQREANILATLAHPAVPNIYDFFDQNNRAYLVMEYINGSDVEALLTKTSKLPVEKIIEWTIDLCEVLHYLHSHQPDPIIFRDMKPSNIMIDSLGKVRLIDFGIAKTFVKEKGTMIGTEGYSAPEQYKGNASPFSDQYSLGATLHHILTRKDPRLEPPFSFHERPIRDFNDEVPQWFTDIIDRALQFTPTDRYENCEEMSNAIKAKLYAGAGTGGAQNGAAADGDGKTRTISNDIEPKWVFKTEDEVRGSATVHDGMVFVGSYDTNVWALSMEDGQLAWKFPTQGGIASTPVVDKDSGLLLFGSEDNTFNAVNYRTGRIVWSFTTKDRIRSSPAVSLGHVFFGSDDGFMYALQSTNGRNLWKFDAGSPVRNRPFVMDDIVIFGTEQGELMATSVSGERKWSYRTRRNVASSPVVHDAEGVCFVGSHDNFLYAVDASNGFSSWRFRTGGPIISTPAIYEDKVIFGSVDKILYCVDINSREKWRFELEDPIVSSPIVYRGDVYFGGTDGKLYCLDASTGEEKWRFRADGPITSTPLIADNTLIFGSMDYKIYALPIFE
ncbi:MAG: serine/threonine-protein kinase [Chloroflexota bacterium]